MNNDVLNSLLLELTKLPKETEWVEFKENNTDPQMIGENISALSNTAALLGKNTLIWCGAYRTIHMRLSAQHSIRSPPDTNSKN